VKTYSATTKIHASPETIWRVLTDAQGYADWDPGTSRVEGRIALGEKVRFYLKNRPDKALKVKITAFKPVHRMVLTAGFPFGLFTTQRTHTLTPNQDGTTTFHTEEVFGGRLYGTFERRIPDLTRNFEDFAAALKARAEE
jgi:uncharacterized protein YndB with AHSA1/START domain